MSTCKALRARLAGPIVTCGLAVAAAAAPLAAQTPEQAGFVIMEGGDTVAVESFTRTMDRVEGEVAGPTIPRATYALEIGPAATVEELTVRVWRPGADPASQPLQEVRITLRGDSAVVASTTSAGTQTQRAPMREGAIPHVNPSFAMMEQIVRRARALGGERVQIPVFLVQGGRSVTATVTTQGADAVTISLAGTEIRADVSADGELLGGSAPAQNLSFTRVDGSLR